MLNNIEWLCRPFRTASNGRLGHEMPFLEYFPNGIFRTFRVCELLIRAASILSHGFLPSRENVIAEKALSATKCLIFAQSARLCRFQVGFSSAV
jgi:hypothetical protein